MSVPDIWLANIRDLVRLEGGGREGYRAVARKAGLNEEYVYQLFEGKPRSDGSPRRPGVVAVGRIARAYADGRSEDWISMPTHGALQAREPSPWSLEGVLAQLGIVLAQVPPAQRNMVAGLLSDWARDGGAEHYLAPLSAALRPPPNKAQVKAA